MDDMTCKVFTDEYGNVLAKACASGDAKIKFNSNFENTYSYSTSTDLNPFPSTPYVDKPWYQDAWDYVANHFVAAWGNPLGQVLILLAALAVIGGVIWWVAQRAQWIDLADDAYDAEDYMDELNEAAAERLQESREDYAYDGEYGD